MTSVAVAVLYPELLGTYGDGGNARVLAQRLAWRGLATEVIEVRVGEAVPEAADIFLLGGGEDGPQALACEQLGASGALTRAVEAGAALLAVCAGFQIIGTSFTDSGGVPRPGLGLIEATTVRGKGPRRVGEVVAETGPNLGLGRLTGYENHAGVTALGPATAPLGRIIAGRGNDDPGPTQMGRTQMGRTQMNTVSSVDGGNGPFEGAIAAKVIGTYLHGPVLARNPALADLLLGWVVGDLAPIDDSEVEVLRSARIEAALDGGSRRRIAPQSGGQQFTAATDRVQRWARAARKALTSGGPAD
ncbi:MAG: type 1 glutamine amidotransferase [Acidimicrobiales bacterium]